MVGAAEVSDALETALRAALGTVDFGANPVYVGSGPSGVSPTDAAPYVVLYVQPPTGDGTAADVNADLTFTVQISAVGNGNGSALRIADAARRAVLGTWAPPAGVVLQAAPKLGAGEQPSRDNDATTPLWYGYELFTLIFTPTSA